MFKMHCADAVVRVAGGIAYLSIFSLAHWGDVVFNVEGHALKVYFTVILVTSHPQFDLCIWRRHINLCVRAERIVRYFGFV